MWYNRLDHTIESDIKCYIFMWYLCECDRLDHIAGLEPLVNLRVLMLGKNRIRKVELLSIIFVLFGDYICQHLSLIFVNIMNLRVLMLGKNRIRKVQLLCQSYLSFLAIIFILFGNHICLIWQIYLSSLSIIFAFFGNYICLLLQSYLSSLAIIFVFFGNYICQHLEIIFVLFGNYFFLQNYDWKVEGLTDCPKLSVLDLHGNRYKLLLFLSKRYDLDSLTKHCGKYLLTDGYATQLGQVPCLGRLPNMKKHYQLWATKAKHMKSNFLDNPLQKKLRENFRISTITGLERLTELKVLNLMMMMTTILMRIMILIMMLIIRMNF